MRRLALFVGLVLCACSLSAHASQQDDRRAYDDAIRCYIANGYVHHNFEKSGDTANAHLLDAKAKQSFDMAYLWGGMLHLSQQEITAEINEAADGELRKLLTDSSYLTTIAKECKRRGLM